MNPAPPRAASRGALLLAAVEYGLLLTVGAASLAALLLVARNRLAPIQSPSSFGLVLWRWLILFYGAFAGALAAFSGFLGVATRREWINRAANGAAAMAFLAMTAVVDRQALPALVAADGPDRYRRLLPMAAACAAAALLSLALAARRRWPRTLTAVAGVLSAFCLWPEVPPASRIELPRAGAGRLLVIGVDGADWRWMEPLIARGDLPHLADLRRRGVWGPLETLQPTLSPVVWTTIATGQTPRRHGVHGFTARRLAGVDEPLPKLRRGGLGFDAFHAQLLARRIDYEAPITAHARKVPAFWELDSAAGARVVVVNWWATWPADPVNGVMVSERAYFEELVRRNRSRAAPPRLTWPPALFEMVAPQIVLPDAVPVERVRAFVDVTQDQYEAMHRMRHPSPLTGIENELTYFIGAFDTDRRLATDLARIPAGQPLDLLVLFRLVDKTCHAALRYSELADDHAGATTDQVKRFGRVVSEAYREVDAAVGELVAGAAGADVVVVSDHGFQLEGGQYGHDRAPAGVFLAAGPSFRRGRVDGVSVYDVLPLLMALKGLPVAEDLPGHVPSVLSASAPAATRIASYGPRRALASKAVEGTAAADAAMLERLKALGYLQ